MSHPDDRATVDIRPLSHGEGLVAALVLFETLAEDASFELVDDHDPLGLLVLLHRTEAAFTWDYLAAGPREWRVLVGRAGAHP